MEYQIKPKKNFSIDFNELWEYRELFYFFTWRDIKIKYKQTVLGIVWVLLQPLLMMSIFVFFFGHALGVNKDGDMPYTLFVFSGLLLWNIFSNGLTGTSNSLLTNANIIKKIYFPRLILPLSALLVPFFDFIFAFLVFVGMLIYYGVMPSASFILGLPCSLLILFCGTFGVGAWLAALNIKYRDFKYIIPFLIQILLFLTPVIYPIKFLPFAWLQKILILNPVTSSIEIFRSTLMGTPIVWMNVWPGIATACLLFLCGIFYFRKTEYYFADLA